MARVVVALGSNIEAEKNLPLAVALLSQMCRVTAVSAVYETAPVGLLEQPNFLNAAVLVETERSASQLKAEVLGEIEKRLERRRTADKNAPRTIDADIILYDDQIFSYDLGDGRLRQLPDPDLLKFPHVAVPVAELVPQMRHPLTAEPLSQIARRLTKKATEELGGPPLRKRPAITALVKRLVHSPKKNAGSQR